MPSSSVRTRRRSSGERFGDAPSARQICTILPVSMAEPPPIEMSMSAPASREAAAAATATVRGTWGSTSSKRPAKRLPSNRDEARETTPVFRLRLRVATTKTRCLSWRSSSAATASLRGEAVDNPLLAEILVDVRLHRPLPPFLDHPAGRRHSAGLRGAKRASSASHSSLRTAFCRSSKEERRSPTASSEPVSFKLPRTSRLALSAAWSAALA